MSNAYFHKRSLHCPAFAGLGMSLQKVFLQTQILISNFKFKNKLTAGFTLFETIISVGLLLVIVGSLGGFVVGIQNAREQLSSITEVDGSARMALSVISQRIRAATGVNGASSTLGSDPGVLSLEMAQPEVNPTIIRLDQDNGVLVLQEGVSSPVELTSDSVSIASFIVTLRSPSGERESVGIAMTARAIAQDDSYTSYEHTLQTSTTLRQ